VANKPPSELVIRAIAGPTPFLYRYGFAAANDVTVMQLNAEVELPGAAAFLPQLARPLIKKGVLTATCSRPLAPSCSAAERTRSSPPIGRPSPTRATRSLAP